MPDDAIDAQLKLGVKKKVALTLESKATIEARVSTSDLVKVYRKAGMGRRVVWSTPRKLLLTVHFGKTLTVPRKAKRHAIVAIKYVILAHSNRSFAAAVQ